ncbi:hypothetical protein P152DRAFT_72353 [Eremomyces bilateralis CBS 781.70]|uniref:Uncharacterized protein n=1 Tax=Eremomyces bilateralis CBS 781.70 TaxID=1392243 RepID=A0A6G1FYK1_9PEZI|nr:uncharacterized protein P152DRAFT_72353 [Eremomyces bilateralis CBS 781.70]KAF1810945.1 hypothetical protein P152DRAFT_72353 [Eremomyces bilateralis CBS 781.70]
MSLVYLQGQGTGHSHRTHNLQIESEDLRNCRRKGRFVTLFLAAFPHDLVTKIFPSPQTPLDNTDVGSSDGENEDHDSDPPPPEYVFQGRARLVDAFYGPDADTLDGEQRIGRRIQVTKDMIALWGLWEPNRRGKRFDWNKDTEDIVVDIIEKKQEQGSSPCLNEMKCPTGVCIICPKLHTMVDASSGVWIR